MYTAAQQSSPSVSRVTMAGVLPSRSAQIWNKFYEGGNMCKTCLRGWARFANAHTKVTKTNFFDGK